MIFQGKKIPTKRSIESSLHDYAMEERKRVEKTVKNYIILHPILELFILELVGFIKCFHIMFYPWWPFQSYFYTSLKLKIINI